MNKKITLDELYAMYKGKGGGPESESIIIDSNIDRKDGYVSIWSNKGDVAKIIERCKKDIISFEYKGDGVNFNINRKAFRGVHCAFRRTK